MKHETQVQIFVGQGFTGGGVEMSQRDLDHGLRKVKAAFDKMGLSHTSVTGAGAWNFEGATVTEPVLIFLLDIPRDACENAIRKIAEVVRDMFAQQAVKVNLIDIRSALV